LGSAYGATLERIKARGVEKGLGMAAMMWIFHPKPPLPVDKICHATAIRIGSNDLYSDGIPAILTFWAVAEAILG